MRNLSWEELDEAVFKLASTFEGVALNGVYGFPRGGLPLAVALSHQLSIPLLKEPEEDCLFVDDVYETLKNDRENLYRECVPILENLIEINNQNEEAIKTLMNIYGTLGDNEGFKKMKALVK